MAWSLDSSISASLVMCDMLGSTSCTIPKPGTNQREKKVKNDAPTFLAQDAQYFEIFDQPELRSEIHETHVQICFEAID